MDVLASWPYGFTSRDAGEGDCRHYAVPTILRGTRYYFLVKIVAVSREMLRFGDERFLRIPLNDVLAIRQLKPTPHSSDRSPLPALRISGRIALHFTSKLKGQREWGFFYFPKGGAN